MPHLALALDVRKCQKPPMKPRLQSLFATTLIITTALIQSGANAQAPAAAPGETAAVAAPAGGSIHDEIQALRDLIELQSKQIQSLSDQLARLTVALENRAAGVPPRGAAASAATEFVVPAARPVQPPQPPANVHVMVKGDSLDKIARTYNTTIADLLKLNKITDPKKLQIGQQILLPPSAAPAAPTTPAAPAPTNEEQ